MYHFSEYVCNFPDFMEVMAVPSGGARARSGPAPDRLSKRQLKANDEWIELPESYDGEVPAFPLPHVAKGNRADREMELWEYLWSLGVASQWVKAHMEYQVALYARMMVSVEFNDRGSPQRYAEARKIGEDLGLTFAGRSRNKWYYPGTREQESNGRAEAARVSSRLEVIDGYKDTDFDFSDED